MIAHKRLFRGRQDIMSQPLDVFRQISRGDETLITNRTSELVIAVVSRLVLDKIRLPLEPFRTNGAREIEIGATL